MKIIVYEIVITWPVHCSETDNITFLVVVFSVLMPCSDVAGYRRFGGLASFIFRVKIRWET